jgi:hypothetical protein
MRAKYDGATPIEILAPASLHFPALSLFTAQPRACKRLRDIFSSNIRNKNTRRAYKEAVRKFSAFCAQHGIKDLAQASRSTLRLSSRTDCGRTPSLLRINGWPCCG